MMDSGLNLDFPRLPVIGCAYQPSRQSLDPIPL